MTLSRCRRVRRAQFAARNSPRAIRGAQFLTKAASPPQRRVFSLDAPDALGALYGPSSRDDRDEAIGSLAEQLATLCAAVGAVRPQVRYAARAHPVARAFAESLHIELAKAAAGEDEHKRGGVASVLVLERGMDLTS